MPLSTTIKTPLLSYTQPLGLFINNEFVPGSSGKKITVQSPHNEEDIIDVHEADVEDVDKAVHAARAAFEGEWARVTPSQRGRLLNRLAELFERDSETIAAIETLDNGKAISLARGDVASSIACFRYYAGWADKIVGQTIDQDPDSHVYTKHEAIGVCGQIIPWNFPIMMWAWKIGPAVATGNTVVMKSSELTPLSALYAAALIKEAGFPPGVVNVISGIGRVAGAAISSHMGIDKIAFTGSTVTGRKILEAAAKSNMKKVTLELGGKSPNIVFADADIDKTITWINHGIYYNQGQSCVAGSRILVQEEIYDTFMEKFRSRALDNKEGDPYDSQTFQGPIISQTQVDRIMGYIDSGKKAGAKIEIGGNRQDRKGFFIEPTIFSGVQEDMDIVQDEIFGPVCIVQKFKDEADAIRISNNTSYGLGAAIHTTNVNTTHHVSSKLKAGTVWVNSYNLLSPQAPFGGFKASGIGRELGSYALDNYTQIKTVKIYMGETLF